MCIVYAIMEDSFISFMDHNEFISLELTTCDFLTIFSSKYLYLIYLFYFVVFFSV